MSKYTNKINSNINSLYINILSLSRNKLFYTNFELIDTFQNRIHLIFIHISFIFIKIKQNNENLIYKNFYQKMFDFIFKNIETNMRELGYGDTTINKNMRLLTKVFYNILINCEKYKDAGNHAKNIFFDKYLEYNKIENVSNNDGIIDYFNKYSAFCFDLSVDSVLKGKLKFNYN